LKIRIVRADCPSGAIVPPDGGSRLDTGACMILVPSTSAHTGLPRPRLAAGDHSSLADLHDVLARAEEAGVAPSSLLLSAMARRNPALVARARRTAEWALLLGESLGLPAVGQQAHDVALLADVGYLSLAPERGTGPWAEWHARQASHDVLIGVASLVSIATGALTVAENFDGSGLPLGLAEEDIPLPARVARLVREFDEASDGWWPGTVGPAVARACTHLVDTAGTVLDPALVHAWLRLLDRHLSEGAA
jgi:HD-GYP domain-containing protein (c-di-GMP phosphodiesterase class II)